MAQIHYLITVNYDECTGCRICELICSLSRVKEHNPERSCIRVVTTEEDGFITTSPVLCMHCEQPFCEMACPTNATYRGKDGTMQVDEKICIGCSSCVFACPFGASSIDYVTKKVFRCNQCEGDPMCVKFCPTGCLEYVRVDKVNMQRKRRGVSDLEKIKEILYKREDNK